MPRSYRAERPLLPLARRVSALGGVVAVLVWLALCGIVEQVLLQPPPAPSSQAGPGGGPRAGTP